MQLPLFLDTAVTQINHALHRIGRTLLLLLLLWIVTLWWGERRIFEQSAAVCEWQRWESWAPNADPHHVLLIADPQLVDPHTYPDRPWPLSTLTIWITDLYMRRTYHYLLEHLEPHTTLFLGDLFDGGREWATATYESPETRYKQYGTNFWLIEYNRFMNLFVKGWHEHNLDDIPGSEGRRIIASLPGNHDLGFAGGIDRRVKNRFDAHFGPLNRIDILGNHTFVSIDTVSLSAMDQPDPATGSSGAGDGSGLGSEHTEIWKPSENFLENARQMRSKAVERRYRHLNSIARDDKQSETKALYKAETSSLDIPKDSSAINKRIEMNIPSSKFPTIVLTHVPLFREADVSCGPMREHGTSIPLQSGYQYQNVLTPLISSDIIKHLDADQVTMIYSGDDHDYCEIEHGEFTGRIREITVKSTSMAMGISRPGVQLASLWNPIDMENIANGQIDSAMPRNTVQNHLCLFPFMAGILIRYLEILGLTLVVLALRAVRYRPEHRNHQGTSRDKPSPLLPLTRKKTPPLPPSQPEIQESNNSSLSSISARARSSGRLNGYGNLPLNSRSNSPINIETVKQDTDDWGNPYSQVHSHATETTSYSHPTLRSGIGRFKWLDQSPTQLGEFMRSLYMIAIPVLSFYAWLLWND